MKTQVCTKCGVEKPLSEFYFRKDRNSYIKHCFDCRKNSRKQYYLENKEYLDKKHAEWKEKNKNKIKKLRKKWRKTHKLYIKDYQEKHKEKLKILTLKSHLKNKYGITIEEYNKILNKQRGVCAICKKTETVKKNNTIRKLTIDHDHKTGKIRGLLCMKCNTALGRFKDNIEYLQSAIKYLAKFLDNEE